LRFLTVVGARPQFIKAAPVSRALRDAGHAEYLTHTGQHYDREMSRIFFDEMQIPEPDINLEVRAGTHASQTAQMLIRLEAVLQEQKPDCVIVYGDTNSTLAGALTTVKLQIPLAHIEAGLRSFNRTMPEEHNRVLTDHCADFLFCPTQTAVNNLEHEGITRGVQLVGDTMFDALLQFGQIAEQRSTILERLDLAPKTFLLATVHRAYNTDDPDTLKGILAGLLELSETVVFPVHPRTREKISQQKTFSAALAGSNLRMIEPVGYLDMLTLERHSRLILTDSGGMQKEAFLFGVPCVTLRPETEWIETVEAGWNVIAGTQRDQIVRTVTEYKWPTRKPPSVFGDGQAGQKIVAHLAATGSEATNH
jgi:UDP-N-acetylglucosamine 2-epimerase